MVYATSQALNRVVHLLDRSKRGRSEDGGEEELVAAEMWMPSRYCSPSSCRWVQMCWGGEGRRRYGWRMRSRLSKGKAPAVVDALDPS